MIEAILYCEFDNDKGSMIMFQFPPMKIANDLFDMYSEFVITKTKLCGKCVSFRHENLVFIGVPQCVEGLKYLRNALLFNLVFVLDITKLKHHYPPDTFKPIASKLSYYLRNLELESEYLFRRESKQNLQFILERIYVDLSTKQECSIVIDTAHSIHLKLIPYLLKPPLVHAHDVPIPIRNLHALFAQQKDSWDITFSQIIPHIDGVSFVKQIAIQSNVHVEIVKKSLQHLLYFQCIKLIDIFQYCNMYALKNKRVMMQLFSRRDLEEEMVHYICPGIDRTNMPDSSQILHHILQIYCKLKPGFRLQEIMEKHHHLCQYINPKCLITYGLLKGFIKRVHEYPFLLKDEPSLVSSSDDMTSSLSSENLDQSGSPTSSSFESSPSKTFTVITKQKKFPSFHIIDRETLRPYITGKYCIDEICLVSDINRSVGINAESTIHPTTDYSNPKLQQVLEKFFSKSSDGTVKHSNNWVVLINTSRFWFNYRHIANTLSFYHVVKKLGVPDSQILLMLADDVACNPRNRYPGEVFNNRNRQKNVYGENVEVDYRGYEVTVEQFLRVLTGRHHDSVPRSKRLMSDEHSNVLIFMTGHGGDEFFKFQDQEEINSADIADTVQQMAERKRFKELLMIVDTCQAGSLFDKLYTPNVLAVGSSLRGQNSYSHHSDPNIGVAVIDRFTYYTLEFFENRNFRQNPPSIEKWFQSYSASNLLSTPNMRRDLFERDTTSVPLTDFFGSDIKIEFQEDLFKRENMTYFSTFSPKHTNNDYKKQFSNEANIGNNNAVDITFQKSVSFLDIKVISIVVIGLLICLIFK